MKKKLFVLPALAVLFVLFTARCDAVTRTENFTNNPSLDGWQMFGDTNLFQWDCTNQDLDVTWNSCKPNSYFYLPLGTTLTEADCFTVCFDMQLNDITWDAYPYFPVNLAVGFFNFADATNAGFSRPDGTTPNLYEFGYFPDNGLGMPSVTATLADMTGGITNFPDFCFIYDLLPMETSITYHVTLTHAAGQADISATMSVNGQIYTTMPYAYPEPIADFRLDTLSVSSYEQDTDYPDMVLAHGTVDNFVVTLPPVVRNLNGAFCNGVWQVQFGTYTNWLYTLERSTDLVSWSNVSAGVNGSGDVLVLCDTNAPSEQAFYRVRSCRP